MLQVSKSGYYSHKVDSVSEKTAVENTVINCFKKHNGNYGRIRIKKALEEKDIFVSEAKISRILKYLYIFQREKELPGLLLQRHLHRDIRSW